MNKQKQIAQIATILSQYNKQQVVEYIQQMEELETREFTLRKTAQNIHKTIVDKKNERSQSISFFENNIPIVRNVLTRAEKHYLNWAKREDCDNEEKWALRDYIKSYRKEKFVKNEMLDYMIAKQKLKNNAHIFENEPLEWPKAPDLPKPEKYEELKDMAKPPCPPEIVDILGPMIGFGIMPFLFFVVSLIDNIVHGFVYNFFTLASGIVTALIVGGFIIYYKFTNRESNPWFTWKKIADYRKAQFNYSMASNKYEHIYLPLFYLYESLRFELDRANRYKSTDNQYYEQLKNQALLLEEYANAIAEQKQKLYENSPIPPDYRTFDCVVMLNYIFRNNLADTMSQAVLLYEDRVFKGEVIRGVQKIYEMLGNLSHSMKAIEYHFLEIRREINTMTSEVCKISEHLYESSELQKDMLNESRATKYAIESVQRSNELLLLHQNQQRGTYYQ